MAAPSTAAHTGVLVAVLATFVVSAAAHLHHSSVADHRMLAAAMRATRDSSPVHRRMMLDAINGTHRGCGAPEVDAAAAAAFEAEMQAEVQASQNQRTAAAPFSATIRVYFHIIQQGNTYNHGAVPYSQVLAQVQELNRAYKPAGFKFELAGTDRTTKSQWFNMDIYTQPVLDMKNKLRRGSRADLNIYTVKMPGFLLGTTGYPFGMGGKGADIRQDGAVVSWVTFPGGAHGGFNMRRTVTRKVGRWMGLYHPFQGGCSQPNDFITDTNPLSGPNYDCVPVGKTMSTCRCTIDHSRNHMGYTYDACMDNFTPQQIAKMQLAWKLYRKPYQSLPKPTPRAVSVDRVKPRPTTKPTKKPTRKPTKRRPTKKRPTKRRPTRKRPTKKRPSKKRLTKRRPDRQAHKEEESICSAYGGTGGAAHSAACEAVAAAEAHPEPQQGAQEAAHAA